MARVLRSSFSKNDINTTFQLGYKLYAIHEQSLKKILADVSFITDKFHKGFVLKRLTVINITRSNHEIQEAQRSVHIRLI